MPHCESRQSLMSVGGSPKICLSLCTTPLLGLADSGGLRSGHSRICCKHCSASPSQSSSWSQSPRMSCRPYKAFPSLLGLLVSWEGRPPSRAPCPPPSSPASPPTSSSPPPPPSPSCLHHPPSPSLHFDHF